MGLPNPYTQYKQTQAQTSGQGKLIIMLHDGAIRFLQQAIAGIQAKDYQKMSDNFNRVDAILIHLIGSLNIESGEIAVNLNDIYRYCQTQLLVANSTESVALVQEVIEHIRSIRDAWDQVERGKPGDAQSQETPKIPRAEWSFAA
jgi:flagellar protein FliS